MMAPENRGGYVLHFIQEAYKHCKPIAATDEAIKLFEHSMIPQTQFATKEGELTEDSGVVTAMGADQLDAFTEKFRMAILKHRH